MEESDEMRKVHLEPFDSAEQVENSIRTSIEHWPGYWHEERDQEHPFTSEQMEQFAGWCKRNKIKQNALASGVGTSRQSVGYWLNGNTSPSREHAAQLVYTASQLTRFNPDATNDLVTWFWDSIDPSGEGRKAETRALVMEDLNIILNDLSTASLGRLLYVAKGLAAGDRLATISRELESLARQLTTELDKTAVDARQALANGADEKSVATAVNRAVYIKTVNAAAIADKRAMLACGIHDVDDRMTAHAFEAERQGTVRYLREMLQIWPDVKPRP